MLPKYRGGTPLQHQILNDEQDTGLTIFRMNNVLDGGDILAQLRFPLSGTITNIYSRMTRHGATATIAILKKYQAGTVTYTPQKNLKKYPAYRRRKPPESELKFEQLTAMSGAELYNFIRALGSPYPNAYITLKEGDCLLIQEIKLIKSPKGKRFDGTSRSVTPRTAISLKDGYAALVRYHVAPQVH
jgi:methionyl-tRNA formyltransferase